MRKLNSLGYFKESYCLKGLVRLSLDFETRSLLTTAGVLMSIPILDKILGGLRRNNNNSQTSNADTVLYRVQAVGSDVSDFTPYFITQDELVDVVNRGDIPEILGLPGGSISDSSQYNTFEIRPLPGETPNFYQSQVAPITENGSFRDGGAIQSFVPNRSQWTEPSLITLNLDGF